MVYDHKNVIHKLNISQFKRKKIKKWKTKAEIFILHEINILNQIFYKIINIKVLLHSKKNIMIL